MLSTQKKYYDELNIFRAFIIVWVVIGHSFNDALNLGGLLHSYAYTFHMPAFFLLSGILFAPKLSKCTNLKSKAELIINRMKRLLVPYLFFTFVSYILKFFFESYANNKLPKGKDIITSILFAVDLPNGGLWFLHQLFILSVIAILLSNINKYILFALSAALKIISIFVTASFFSLPVIGLLSNYCLYFFGGIILSEHYDKLSHTIITFLKAKKAVYISAVTIFLAISFTVSFIYVNKEKNEWLSLFICIFNIIIWYLVSHTFNSFTKLKAPIMTVGNYGMDIYMLGYYVQIAIRVVCGSMLNIPYNIYSLMMLIFGLILPIPISKYIVRKFKVTRILVLGDFSKQK